MGTLQSFIGGRWHGREAHQPLHSALNNSLIYHTHAETIDFGEVLDYGRKTGIPALMALDFQQRAARLKALALYLMERKEHLYEISRFTGATRPDSWVISMPSTSRSGACWKNSRPASWPPCRASASRPRPRAT